MYVFVYCLYSNLNKLLNIVGCCKVFWEVYYMIMKYMFVIGNKDVGIEKMGD